MNFKLEICVDNVESAIDAQNAGADRIELSGGTTGISEFSRKVIDPDMIRSVINILKLI